jgi:hypothetical protein
MFEMLSQPASSTAAEAIANDVVTRREAMARLLGTLSCLENESSFGFGPEPGRGEIG